MSARVRVERGPGGRLVAAKAALDAADAQLLHREAELLDAARHPGVVECLGAVERVGGPELLTAWVGPRSLALAQPTTVRAAGAVVAALARTVAVLHERGLVHHRLDATHVLLDPRGRPVLCGFAHAGPAGEVAPGGTPRRPAADVAALGALLAELVRTSRRRRRRAGRADALLARRLTVVADRTRTAPPTARDLAAELEDVLGPDLKRITPTRRQPRRQPLPAFGRGAVVAVAGIAVAGLLVIGSASTGGGGLGERSRSPAPERTVDGQAVGAEVSSEAAHGATSEVVPVVVLDGRRYEVGLPGDQAAVADWRCDGEPAVALLRPETGHVFLFERWAQPGAEVTSAPFAEVDLGTHLLVPDDEACPELAVVHGDGVVEAVPLPSSDRTRPTEAPTKPGEVPP